MQGMYLWRKVSIVFLLTIFLLFEADLLTAQSGLPATRPEPRGFASIKLGQDVETVKEELKKESYFNYRGDPDVSFLPHTEQILIECSGFTYVRRGYFQFNDKKLYIIIIELNRDEVDYFSTYSALVAKYGEPTSITPTEAVWDYKTSRLSLEKPLSVKYVDKGVLKKLVEEGKAKKSFADTALDDFLKQF